MVAVISISIIMIKGKWMEIVKPGGGKSPPADGCLKASRLPPASKQRNYLQHFLMLGENIHHIKRIFPLIDKKRGANI